MEKNEKLKLIDYSVGDSCAFLIPGSEKEESGVSYLLRNINIENRKDVLFVAREAIMEDPEKFSHKCLRDKKCDNCPAFRKYN